jgi:hypothetical protein
MKKYTLEIIDDNHYKIIADGYDAIFIGTETEGITKCDEMNIILLENLKIMKIKEVQCRYQKMADDGLARFTKLEQSTFEDQKKEYRAYTEDNNAPTPTIDILCTARGVTKEYLIEKIGANIQLQIMTVGLQQAEEDKVKSIKTLDEFFNTFPTETQNVTDDSL